MLYIKIVVIGEASPSLRRQQVDFSLDDQVICGQIRGCDGVESMGSTESAMLFGRRGRSMVIGYRFKWRGGCLVSKTGWCLVNGDDLILHVLNFYWVTQDGR